MPYALMSAVPAPADFDAYTILSDGCGTYGIYWGDGSQWLREGFTSKERAEHHLRDFLAGDLP